MNVRTPPWLTYNEFLVNLENLYDFLGKLNWLECYIGKTIHESWDIVISNATLSLCNVNLYCLFLYKMHVVAKTSLHYELNRCILMSIYTHTMLRSLGSVKINFLMWHINDASR